MGHPPSQIPSRTLAGTESVSRASPSIRQTKSYCAPSHTAKPTITCPYCEGSSFIKDGLRSTKHGSVQRYRCAFCDRRFTQNITKHRTYPMRVIIETLSRYNRLHPLPKVIEDVRKKFGVSVPTSTARYWLSEFATKIPFLRLRNTACQYARASRRTIFEYRLLHGQVYDFKYHRTKTDLLIATYPENNGLSPLRTYLDSIPKSCPPDVFGVENPRASQATNVFPISNVRITARADNTAVESARFALQAVIRNKLRHEVLQEFMLVNDSATIAVEVPIVLTHNDITHYRESLSFQIPLVLSPKDVFTGHIDIVQIRNGQVHILDYKPDAAHVRPIEQLMIYSLALARRTGLRLYHFRCAWFDSRDYFEFYPLHVVHERRR